MGKSEKIFNMYKLSWGGVKDPSMSKWKITEILILINVPLFQSLVLSFLH